MEHNNPKLIITVETGTHRKTVYLDAASAQKDALRRTWTIRQTITLNGQNVILQVGGTTDYCGAPLTENIQAVLLDINGSPITEGYTIRRKRWYEIVRIDNQGGDTEDFEKLSTWHRRGWNRKILRHLTDWDYGPENYGAAKTYGNIWDTPTDPRENDRVLAAEKKYVLCHANSGQGVYEAFYLVRECNQHIR